jgi:hypothetical protein
MKHSTEQSASHRVSVTFDGESINSSRAKIESISLEVQPNGVSATYSGASVS